MFRRRIIICSQHAGTQTRVRAALEDDFHHFRVEIASAEGRVTRVDGAAPRQPYTLCGDAVARLDSLLGMPISPTAHEVTRVTDPTEQCTHLFELAGLAIAAAARGTALRLYDVEVPVRQKGRTRPRLSRDGAALLAWEVLGSAIQGPMPYAGVDLYQGMARWALTALSTEEAEAALVLRRATVISLGRGMPLDAQVHAKPNGNCYSQQPRRASEALRVIGSTLDFACTPERLCADDLGWLSFKEHGDGC